MRPSPHRHTLAVLRTVLGFTQKQMADLLGCSRPTIQAIELGKLRLSEKLAERVGFETGVQLRWLMSDDPSVPPKALGGEPYTREVFELAQANKRQRGSKPPDQESAQSSLLFCMRPLLTLILEAYERDKLNLAAYKLHQAFEQIRKELGAPSCSKFLFDPPADFGMTQVDTQEAKRPLAIQVKELIADFEAHFGRLYRQKLEG